MLTPPEVDALLTAGRFDHADAALDKLQDYLPELEHAGEPAALLHGLYGRGMLLRLTSAPAQDVVAACDVLERAAQERRAPVWSAAACAMRARAHVDTADIGAAMSDLSRVDLDQLAETLDGAAGFALLDVLAATYARLRLNDRLDEVRGLLEQGIDDRSEVERATHWAGWSTELAGRGMEPIASGAAEPDYHLLDQAVDVAARLEGLPADAVPARLHRTAHGVRALTAAYHGRPSEALRLLGKDAFADPRDLPPMERQVVTLAAMHAHALLGSVATARSLDEAATQHIGALPDLVLEVTRSRERLWLESHAGGDVIPVLYRLTGLLVRLGWQGMDLVADTARQALEHQALRTESRTDALTGVGNRRALDEELRHMLRFGPLPMALVLVDVDDFKSINDRFTHVIGDEVLRRVAAALSQQLRLGDKILRYGGDEFVILLPRTGDQEARHVADRMGKAISRLPWAELADGLKLAISTGCASMWSLSGRRPDGDAERLFRRADEALLEAKRDRELVPEPDAWPGGPAGPAGRPGAGRRAMLAAVGDGEERRRPSPEPHAEGPEPHAEGREPLPARPEPSQAAGPEPLPRDRTPQAPLREPSPDEAPRAPRAEPRNGQSLGAVERGAFPVGPLVGPLAGTLPEPRPARLVERAPEPRPDPSATPQPAPAWRNPPPARQEPAPAGWQQPGPQPSQNPEQPPLRRTRHRHAAEGAEPDRPDDAQGPATPAQPEARPWDPPAQPRNPLARPAAPQEPPPAPAPRGWPDPAERVYPEPGSGYTGAAPTVSGLTPGGYHPPAWPSRPTTRADHDGSSFADPRPQTARPDPYRRPEQTARPDPYPPPAQPTSRTEPVAAPGPLLRHQPAPEPQPQPRNANPDPLAGPWPSPLAADPLTSRSASERMLTPPPEPGRTGAWNHRGTDPATGALPLDPGFLDAPATRRPADRTWNPPERSQAPAPAAWEAPPRPRDHGGSDDPDSGGLRRPDPEQTQRSRRRPPVIDLGATEGPNRTPFG